MTRQPILFIDGEAGTTGLGLRARLEGLPVTLRSVAHERRKDPKARLDAMAEADLIALCLPDDAAREAVAMAESLGANAPRVLDASTAFRTAPGWVYGFPEMTAGQAEAIAAAQHVSNPGCYPTGAIGLLRPLIEAGILSADHPLSINAVSGYSGGGRSMIEAHEAEGGPAFELYGLGLAHKHTPEIQHHVGLGRRPIFVPSVGHFPQGMIVSIPLHLADLNGDARGEDLHAALSRHYAGATRVTVAEAVPSLVGEALADSDGMELRVHANDAQGHVLLTARLDNLGKGASGAAIQNIALMLGIERA